MKRLLRDIVLAGVVVIQRDENFIVARQHERAPGKCRAVTQVRPLDIDSQDAVILIDMSGAVADLHQSHQVSGLRKLLEVTAIHIDSDETCHALIWRQTAGCNMNLPRNFLVRRLRRPAGVWRIKKKRIAVLRGQMDGQAQDGGQEKENAELGAHGFDRKNSMNITLLAENGR